MKTLIISLIFLLFGCNHYYTKEYSNVSYSNNNENIVIGIGSAKNSGNSEKAFKLARLRALNDLALQMQSIIIISNNLQNSVYEEDVKIVTKAVLKNWKEIQRWEDEKGYCWSKVAINKNDYYNGIKEYISVLSDSISYYLEMAKSGSIIERLNNYENALILGEKLSKSTKNSKIANKIKIKIQNFIDTILIESKIECNKISCIKTKISIFGKEDNSIFVKWHIENNKFIGSLNVGEIKNKLMSYGIMFPILTISKISNPSPVLKKEVESFITPKIRMDTIFSNEDNNVVTDLIQIADTTTFRKHKFFLRRKYKYDQYALFSATLKSDSKLSSFALPKNRHMMHMLRLKFYAKKNESPNNDITEIYFDDKFIYAENIVSLYYVNENNEWHSINMNNEPLPLTILSKPKNAHVFINGEYKGKTPCYLSNLKQPFALITIKKEGFYSFEYFSPLIKDIGTITKRFVLKRLPELKYGTFIESDVYYAEDSSSTNSLKRMIDEIDSSLHKQTYTSHFFKLNDILAQLKNYQQKIEDRIYCQYFSANNLNLEKKNNTISNFILSGSFQIPIEDFEEVNLNVDQCFIKIEYKKINETAYKIVRTTLKYKIKEYLFDGKTLFINN